MFSVQIHLSNAPINSPRIAEPAQRGLSSGDALVPETGSHNPTVQFEVLGAASTMEIRIPKLPEQWKSHDAKRFKDLAIKKAMGSASAEQLQELQELSIRRRLSNIRTDPELLLFEFRYQRAVDELRKFLEQNSDVLKSISEGSSSSGSASR